MLANPIFRVFYGTLVDDRNEASRASQAPDLSGKSATQYAKEVCLHGDQVYFCFQAVVGVVACLLVLGLRNREPGASAGF